MASKPYLSLVRPWDVTELGEIATTRIFTVRRRRCQSLNDPSRGGDFSYLECPDWVNVVAVTSNDEIVMVEQFRYGTAKVTLELPGGVVDDEEDPVETCRRELLEETGFAGDPVVLIGSVQANPAMQNNRCHFGVVRNARLVGGQQPDEHEEIGVRLVKRGEVVRLVDEGLIDHSLIVAGLFRFELWATRGSAGPVA